MPGQTPRLLLAVLAALAIGIAGCGKGPKADNRAKASGDAKAKARELNDFAKAYHSFLDTERRPPQSFEELNRKFPLPPVGAQATVFWGAGVGGIEDGPATGTVLAYLPNPDGPGKLVLFCDGLVDVLTDADFAAARKAQPRTKR